MVFNSLTYVYFLLSVFFLHWLAPVRWRLSILLVASVVFYCSWKWEYGFLLLSCVLVNFGLAHFVAQSRLLFWLAIIFNLSLLGYYKYLGFFADTFNALTAAFRLGQVSVPMIVLPLGISFFTFHAMSYIVDVYRGVRGPERGLLRFALYQMFWPHLIAGPILRSHELIPQFEIPREYRSQEIAEGLRRILGGMFKKVVLADNLAPFIDEGFRAPNYLNNSAWDNWTLAFAFGLQIYFDFSAYSDIAIGSARLFGYRFAENFNYPYLATTPREFWRRWHITLSSWIRDYLYIPLQSLARRGSTAEGGINVDSPESVGFPKSTYALLVTWGLMGLWHGANWTFVVWGLWHGLYIFAFRLWDCAAKRWRYNLNKWVVATGGSYVIGFLITIGWVMLGWIFFRSRDLSQAITMLGSLIQPDHYQRLNLHPNFHVFAFACFASVYIHYFFLQLSLKWEGNLLFQKGMWLFHSVKYSSLVILIAAFFKQGTTFIYFQF